VKGLHEIKRDVVRVCKNIDARQFVGGRDGNVSVRISDSTILVTPAGFRKGDIEVEDLLLVDRKGRVVQGRGKASTETGMHLRVYELRPDVRAVAHAHPPVATGFAAAGIALTDCVLPEVIVGLGRVPLARYATPGTPELSESLDPVIRDHDAWLLQNHGAVAVGADVLAAYQRLETVEHSARILLVARLLGGPDPLTRSQVEELLAARSRYGVREGLAGCDVPAAPECAGDDDIVERVAERVLEALRAEKS
jgi:L-fuculose-phosphate aldolase